MFCVVAVVDGVVEFGSDRDFYPAVNFMIFSNHDEGDVTDGRSVVVGERIWFGVTQCRISGVGHNGNMYVVQVIQGLYLPEIVYGMQQNPRYNQSTDG